MVNDQPGEPIGSDVIIGVHDTLVDWFADSEDPISPPGVKDLGLIESAVARPFQSVGGVAAYDTIFGQAAALFHSLINNHAFYNGNKRVALVAAQVLLMQNKLWIDGVSDNELFEFTRKTAAHEITTDRGNEVEEITSWLSRYSRKAMKGEHPLKYIDLKHALARFGFDIDPPVGQFLNIYKEGKIVERIAKEGIQGFRPYHTDYISGLRRRLGLTTEAGVDSSRFYGEPNALDVASQFIELRIEVMRRLAQT